MASNVKVNGTWKSVSSVKVKVNGAWKSVTYGYVKVNGSWKQWLSPAAPPPPPVGPPPPPPPPIISYPPPPPGGGGTTYYTVPNVVGQSVSAAQNSITGSGNLYGGSSGGSTTSTQSQNGVVYAQSPASGTYTSQQTVSVTYYQYQASGGSGPTVVSSVYTSSDCSVVSGCSSGYENIRKDTYSDGSIQYVSVCCTPVVTPPPPPPACTCNYSTQSYDSGCYRYYYDFAPECCAPNCCPNINSYSVYIGCPPPPPPPPPPTCSPNEGLPCNCSGCGYVGIRTCSGACDCSGCVPTPPPPPPPPIISYPPPPPPIPPIISYPPPPPPVIISYPPPPPPIPPIISYPPPPPPPIISYPPPPPPIPPIISYPPPPPPPPPSGGGGCFVGSTLISTPNGYVKAEDIKVGSLVNSLRFNELSLDETSYTLPDWSSETLTPMMVTKAVVRAVVVRKQVDVYLDLNGDLVTPEHRVLVKSNGAYSFKEAGDVHLGDLVLRKTGMSISDLVWEPVVKNEVIEKTAMVYLFDTEQDDVMFSANLLSHNMKL